MLAHTSTDLFYNSTIDTNKVMCTFPPSGPYGVLQRMNFYATFLFILCYRHKTLLVKGAAGALMVCSGVTAIHAIALASFTARHRETFDDDIVGV